jgi:rRNA maturation protein Nop10
VKYQIKDGEKWTEVFCIQSNNNKNKAEALVATQTTPKRLHYNLVELPDDPKNGFKKNGRNEQFTKVLGVAQQRFRRHQDGRRYTLGEQLTNYYKHFKVLGVAQHRFRRHKDGRRYTLGEQFTNYCKHFKVLGVTQQRFRGHQGGRRYTLGDSALS